MINSFSVGIEKNDELTVEFDRFTSSGAPFISLSFGVEVRLYFYDKAKVLELAEKLKQAAQEWIE